MKTGRFFFGTSAIVVLCELSLVSARATLPAHVPRGLGIDGLHSSEAAGSGIMRWHRGRAAAATDTTTASLETAATNATIAQACISTLANITDISNEAGMSACYNILQHDVNRGTFQADLRLYQMQQPSGSFSGVAASQMFVDLVFPTSTTFTLLKTKRSIVTRQTSSTTASTSNSASAIRELQQYSLTGAFTSTVDASKLNQTELLALMIPSMTIVAAQPNSESQAEISTNITMTDIAFFVVGDFQNDFTPALATTALQTQAIAQSSQFTLPGTSLGIFPTGLIVTCAWTFLFLTAYGLGTIGRFRHRSFYRKRIKALRGRTGLRL